MSVFEQFLMFLIFQVNQKRSVTCLHLNMKMKTVNSSI